jgi:hypothetical protein
MNINPSQTELWNCQNAFEFICPQTWESLVITESEDIRYCEVCRQNVYLCKTPNEFVQQGNLDRCVAISEEVIPKQIYTQYTNLNIYSILTGRPAKINETRYQQEQEWWLSVLNLNPNFNLEQIEDIRRAIDSNKLNFEER